MYDEHIKSRLIKVKHILIFYFILIKYKYLMGKNPIKYVFIRVDIN